MTNPLEGFDKDELLRMDKLLQIRDTRVNFAKNHHRNTNGHKMDFTDPYLHDIYNTLAPRLVLQSSVQSGKALWEKESVLTPSGWVEIGGLEEGNLVSTPDGGSAEVLGVYTQGKKVLYTITLEDGRSVEACGDHLWLAWQDGRSAVLSTNEIVSLGKPTFIPVAEPSKTGAIYSDILLVKSIVPGDTKEAVCIEVNSPARLFITKDYIITHNSEMLVIDHFAMAACGLAVLFILPKYDLRNRFVQNRINKVVEGVEEYRRQMGNNFFDSIQLKYFGKGTINYVGSNVEKDFYEIPTNAAIIDEYDHCDQKNLRYVPDRMSAVTNKYPFIRFSGNPKYPGRGINQLYLDSDKRVWQVPCKACGKTFELDWFKVGVDILYDKSGNVLSYNLKDTEWESGCGRDVHLICTCGGILDRHSKKGIWVPTNPDGNAEGYLISKLFTRQSSVAQLWRDFGKSVHNPGLMAWFYSSILGIPPSGVGNRVTPDLMRSCAKLPEFHIRDNEGHISDTSEGPCTMGIDVGADLDVRISLLRRGKRLMQYVGKVRTKEDLYDLMKRFSVEYAVIDSGPELHLVDEIQNTAPIPVWRCRFHAGEGKAQNISYNTKEMEVRVDRTFIMDRAFAQLKTKKNILPENFSELLGGDYLDEMTASVRELVVDQSDNERYEWMKTKDHQWLADCYDILASDFLESSTFGGIEIL